MRTLDIMPVLAEKGIHFDFCTLAEGGGELDKIIEGYGGLVHNCPLRKGFFAFVKKFYQLLSQNQYDVVHSHVHYFSGKIAEIAYRAEIKKRIVHFRTLHDGKSRDWKRWFYHQYMKYLIDRYATNILAVCQGVLDYSWKQWPKDPRCKVIYNGIDLAPFQSSPCVRAEVCNELGLEEQKKILINIGSFQPAKAHDVLLSAVSKIIRARRDIHVLLVGDGDLRRQMENMADALGISAFLKFLGKRSDVPRLLQASDCFILSSRREGLPGVVLEALAAHLPVVATDLPGVREIAQHSSNLKIVPVESSEALALGVLQILQDLDADKFVSSPFPSVFERSFCADRLSQVYLD